MRTMSGFAPAITVMAVLIGGCSDSYRPTAPSERALRASSNRGLSQAAFTSLSVPGGANTLALDINESGLVVGRYASGSRTHGFLYSAGTYRTIDFPGAGFTVAAGINDSGAVVGWYTLPAAPALRHGFLLKDGVFTTFDPPGSTFTNALGINARGDISGRYCALAVCRPPGHGDFHAFLLHDGAYSIIDVPGADESNSFKVDNSGAVVGGFGDLTGDEQLFVYRKGQFTTVPLPNGKPVTQDQGDMNTRGDIVGTYCDVAKPCLIATTGTHGFLLSGGELMSIDYPGALATAATGVNSRGDIVGAYFDEGGMARGFLLIRGRGL